LDNHTGGQAETLHFGNGGGKFRIIYNCAFYGHQDTILTSGRVWFYKCYVEGDTDYIWGSSDVCLFEECEIVSIDHNSGYIFASRTPYIGDDKKASKGYVIFNSVVRSLSNGGPYFGRTQADDPPTRYDQAAIINATIHGNYNKTLWSVTNTRGILDNGEHAGFKVYNLKTPSGGDFDVSGKAARTSVMTDDLYLREYSGRYAILNRIYVPDTGEYTFADVKWDIVRYESEFNASK
jgi:pectin methylesterase-like acyl-CoA thioesterase